LYGCILGYRNIEDQRIIVKVNSQYLNTIMYWKGKVIIFNTSIIYAHNLRSIVEVPGECGGMALG